MVSVAGIKINRGSGSGDGMQIDKLMLQELKKLTGIQDKSSKLSMAGMGMSGIAGVLTLTGIMRLIERVSPKSASNFNPEAEFGQTYEKAMIEGERKIIGIDNQTGKITEILTEREARERNILDEMDNIVYKYDSYDSVFDRLTKNTDKVGDWTVLNAETLEKITGQSAEQNTLLTGLIESVKTTAHWETVSQNLAKGEATLRKDLNDALRAKIRKAGGGSSYSGTYADLALEGVGLDEGGQLVSTRHAEKPNFYTQVVLPNLALNQKEKDTAGKQSIAIEKNFVTEIMGGLK